MVKSCHEGPLRVQRPFYPANEQADECHVYLLHPPGGFVGNDTLEIEGTLAAGTHVLVTTPSAGKFYRVLPGRWQRQQVRWSIKSAVSPCRFRRIKAVLGFTMEQVAFFLHWQIRSVPKTRQSVRFDLVPDSLSVPASRIRLAVDNFVAGRVDLSW